MAKVININSAACRMPRISELLSLGRGKYKITHKNGQTFAIKEIGKVGAIGNQWTLKNFKGEDITLPGLGFVLHRVSSL